MLTQLMNAKKQQDDSSTANNDKTKQDATSSMPDMETMMRLMRIIKSSNQNSPSKELLQSLKPFLNENRKEKIDQYIQIIGITKAIEAFQEMGDISK